MTPIRSTTFLGTVAVHENEPPSLTPRFAILALACAKFSRDIMRATSPPDFSNPWDAVDRYLFTSRIASSRPSLDVITALYLQDCAAAVDRRSKRPAV